MAATIALYLRISTDDEHRDESCSVENQRDLLRAYVSNHADLAACNILEFSDDGWSGGNFQRPQVQALLDLARRGGVQSILVKDLSRWGRSYPEVSEHLDQIFPFLGVRFISVNDHYDSDDYKGSTAPMDVAFASILHDVYCKELSVKVRQSWAEKAKKGEYISGEPPFGFVKSQTYRHRLTVDEEAAETVRRVFELACAGYGNGLIAALLNGEGAETPLMYRKRKGRVLRGEYSAVSERVYWTAETVRRMIIDERYTGALVSGKKRVATPGGHKILTLPESEWIRVPNAHEPLVSHELFDKVQLNFAVGKASRKPNGADNIFRGKIVCGHCGHSMSRDRFNIKT